MTPRTLDKSEQPQAKKQTEGGEKENEDSNGTCVEQKSS